MATLYRKHRPQNWQEVVGQNHIKITIQHEIASDKLTHAYLFSGPRGVGKTTLARVLAKSVNCEKRKANAYEPCNTCQSCLDITAGRSLDIVEIDAASHTGVDNVRENIIAASRISVGPDRYRVFIIDEVHMLSISAFNALLKILEEPPEKVIFILCTTEVHKIPKTIISRCERFDFKRISVSDIMKKLTLIIKKENIKIASGILEAVARHSEGHMRDAESLLGQLVAVGGREISQEEADLVIPRSDLEETIRLIGQLAQKDAAGAIELVNKVIDEGIDLKKFLADLIELLRKVMLLKISPSLADRLALELGESAELKINEISRDLAISQVIGLIERFMHAQNDIKNSFIEQLPIEVAIAEYCAAEQIGTPPMEKAPANQASRPAVHTVSLGGTKGNDFSFIYEKWNEVLAKVKEHNHSLSFILRVCQPKSLSGNQLCLAFKYKFHKDRIGEIKIKNLLENILKDVYGRPLLIEAIIDENMEVANGAAAGESESTGAKENGKSEPKPSEGSTPKEQSGGGDDMMNQILKSFGGKVVK